MFNGMNQLVFNNSLGILSKIFGNLVGLVEVRKGKLFKQSKIKQHLIKQLKAGDILKELLKY